MGPVGKSRKELVGSITFDGCRPPFLRLYSSLHFCSTADMPLTTDLPLEIQWWNFGCKENGWYICRLINIKTYVFGTHNTAGYWYWIFHEDTAAFYWHHNCTYQVNQSKEEERVFQVMQICVCYHEIFKYIGIAVILYAIWDNNHLFYSHYIDNVVCGNLFFKLYRIVWIQINGFIKIFHLPTMPN